MTCTRLVRNWGYAMLAFAACCAPTWSATAQQDASAGDAALAALTADPAEQEAAREILRARLGPIGALIGAPMVRTIYQPAYVMLSIVPHGAGYQVVMSSTDSVEGDRNHLWIDLDADLNPISARSSIGLMNSLPLPVAETTATSISFIDRTQGTDFMMIFSVTEDDEIVWDQGYFRRGRFRRLPNEWSWHNTYRLQDASATLAQIDAYAARSERAARREASRDAVGRTLFGAMVGGWTSSDTTEGMLAGARAGAAGPEALQQELANRAAIARAEAAGSETRFQQSLMQLRMQQNSQLAGMGGVLVVAAPQMTAGQRAQQEELERFAIREQLYGSAPGSRSSNAESRQDEVDNRPAQEASRQLYVYCFAERVAIVHKANPTPPARRHPTEGPTVPDYTARTLFLSNIGTVAWNQPGEGEFYVDAEQRLANELTGLVPTYVPSNWYVTVQPSGGCTSSNSYNEASSRFDEHRRNFLQRASSSGPRDTGAAENIDWTPGR